MLYAKEQRVCVPGTHAQGVVVDAIESTPGFPIYTLRWLTEAGETMTGSVGEGDLRRANRTEEDDIADHNDSLKREDEIAQEVERRLRVWMADITARRRRKAVSKRKR